eukprot:1698362-Pleurochrysis_carterae.AAC.1
MWNLAKLLFHTSTSRCAAAGSLSLYRTPPIILIFSRQRCLPAESKKALCAYARAAKRCLGAWDKKCAAIGHAYLRLAASSGQWCRAASR